MHATDSFPDLDLAGLLKGLQLVALRRLGDADEAEDAAQETLRRVLATLRGSGIPSGYALQSYAHGVLRHVTADVLRARQRFTKSDVSDIAAPDASALDQLVSHERLRQLRKALRHLDREERALLRRCYVDGEKIADIARETAEPAERLRKRKSRALEKLRTLLKRRSHTSLEPDD